MIHISKRILVLNPHRLSAKYQKGGQVRTFALFKELTKKFEVLLLSIATYLQDDGKRWNVQNALKEQLVYEGVFHTILRIIVYFMGWPSDFNHILLRSSSLSRVITSKIDDFDIICFEFPYLINYLKKKDGKLLCYNAHNVEYELIQKKYSNKRIIFKKFVLMRIYEAEKKTCEICDIVLTTSQRDRDLMKKIYSIKNEKIYVVPNGAWTKDINATKFNEKIIAKKQFNVRNAILFIGGSYDPNFEAVKYIYKWAEQIPKYDFLIIGSSGSILKNVKPLDNLKILGSVDEEEKKKALIAADIAINPILVGSGTNLKMLEYLAAGLPIITTREGNRGLDLEHLDSAIISEIDSFLFWIDMLFSDKTLYERLSINGRAISKSYDWEKIALDLENLLELHS